jgi:hypothetical protein
VLEELLHQGVVGLGHHFDQAFARGLRGVGEAIGNRASVTLPEPSSRIGERRHRHEVDRRP